MINALLKKTILFALLVTIAGIQATTAETQAQPFWTRSLLTHSLLKWCAIPGSAFLAGCYFGGKEVRKKIVIGTAVVGGGYLAYRNFSLFGRLFPNHKTLHQGTQDRVNANTNAARDVLKGVVVEKADEVKTAVTADGTLTRSLVTDEAKQTRQHVTATVTEVRDDLASRIDTLAARLTTLQQQGINFNSGQLASIKVVGS